MRRHINIIALLAIIILAGCKREDDLIPVAKISFKDTYSSEFTSVTLNCEVKSNVTIETLNVEYSTSKDMSESQQVEMSLIKDNTYSATISNLSIQTEYYYRFVVGNKVSEFFDDQKRTFKTLNYTAPVVNTEDATNISGTKATLIGVVEFACEKPILEQGFMIGTEEDKLESYKVDESDFILNIKNLDYKTTYYYRAYAKNDIGTGLGEIKTFQTCGAVSFNEIKLSSITANSVMVETGVADNGGIEVDLQGIRYCIKGNDEVSFVETNGAITISNLKHDTTYEVWGYAKTFEGEFEGNRVEFNTLDGKVLITTSSPANVTTSSATLKGNITSDGGSKITERGFCYSTRDIPTLSDIKIKVTGETGTFESELTNLPQNVQYNVRAYAINAIDTYYGEVVSFTTLYDSATFGTLTTSDITASSASLQCSITSNGGSTITKCGFCYSTYKNPTVDDQVFVVSDSKTNLNATIKGLKSGITYYVRAFATNANSTFYSDEISFITSEGIIQFTDPSTDNIAAASFIVSSNILTAGGGTITERGFCYNIAKNPTTENKIVKSSSTLGEYSATITDLQNKTTYYIRAYAINESGTYYSKEITVKTLDGVASLTTSDATDVKAQSATLNGNITSDGGSNITERGFCYSTSDNPTVDDSTIKIEGTIGDISFSLTGLNHATKYYVRSFAKNGYGTHYGNQISFTTSSGVVDFDQVSTTSITVSSVQLSTKISTDGNSAITQRGFCYSTTSNPTTSDNIITITGTLGELTGKVTGLSNGVCYYVRAFATNAIGTHYSDQISFTTFTGLADVTTSAVTNIMAESVTLNGNIPSENGGTITSRGFCYSTSENPTINNNKVTVTGTTGQMTKSVANLEENTKYYVRAFAATSFGTTYGQQITFTTRDGIVNFTSINSSEILATSVNVSSSISTDGGSPIIEKGFCYSISATPTTTDKKLVVSGADYSQSSTITGLDCSTTYYIRAYARNNIGTYYSQEINVTTDTGIATLSAFSVYNVGQTTVDVSCFIEDNGGAEIQSRGFCYSTSSNPTIESDNIVIAGDEGNMSCTISELMSDQDYYVKAFAKTEHKTTYSEEIRIHTVAGLATLANTKVIDVKETSVTVSADLLSKGGVEILDMGFCYSYSSDPTINDNKHQFMSDVGTYECTITNLDQFTTYYIRPYATTKYGTTYGETISCKTYYYPVDFGPIEIEKISPTNAYVHCSVLSYGDNDVIEQGICYSTSQTPTTEDIACILEGTYNNDIIVITGLSPNTTYYARRFVKNKIKIFYSEVVSFTTIDVPVGAVAGLFSVSEQTSVYIASGNLLKYETYHTIADEQYYVTGNTPFTGKNKYPYDLYYSNFTKTIDDVIGIEGTWRALSKEEWEYLINKRENAINLRLLVYINNNKGLLLLPDNWHFPEGMGMPQELESITLENWVLLEKEGAVFLPSAGHVRLDSYYWDYNKISNIGESTHYCSSSPSFEIDPYTGRSDGYYYLMLPEIKVDTYYRLTGSTTSTEGVVRLVRDYILD